jgi:hypothetical protein
MRAGNDGRCCWLGGWSSGQWWVGMEVGNGRPEVSISYQKLRTATVYRQSTSEKVWTVIGPRTSAHFPTFINYFSLRHWRRYKMNYYIIIILFYNQ